MTKEDAEKFLATFERNSAGLLDKVQALCSGVVAELHALEQRVDVIERTPGHESIAALAARTTHLRERVSALEAGVEAGLP